MGTAQGMEGTIIETLDLRGALSEMPQPSQTCGLLDPLSLSLELLRLFVGFV